jgi:hypothetical protein
MGIAAKFGSELLMRAYQDYIYGVSNNRLLGQSEAAVTQIANRLQYRVKESIIFREGDHTGIGAFISSFAALASASNNIVDSDGNTTVVEWVGYDIDGWHGDGSSTTPTWSGIIDLDGVHSTSILNAPATDNIRISNVISALSPSHFNGDGSALFFIGDESVNVRDGFAWNGSAIMGQNGTNLHPVNLGANQFSSAAATHDFAGVDVYEYYRLSWTAYALELQKVKDAKGIERGTLLLHYDYRPWLGDTYMQRNDGTTPPSVILMENVQTLRFSSIGDVLKVQVCVGDGDIFKQGAYSVCKEKTIF